MLHAVVRDHVDEPAGDPKLSRLRPRSADLELYVVGIAEDEDADPERLAEVPDLAVRDAVLVKHPHRIIQRGA
jgi:hypothetical protein